MLDRICTWIVGIGIVVLIAILARVAVGAFIDYPVGSTAATLFLVWSLAVLHLCRHEL